MTDSEIFLPAGFFMFRSPLLPMEYFLEICLKKVPDQIFSNYFSHSIVQEAILLASPNLYFSLQEKKVSLKKRFSSLLRYLIRMSTRATPFGLFAAVGFGKIDQKTHISFNAKKKFARPNMQWLYEVISSLEGDIKILENCKVKANSPILNYAGRLFLPCSRNLEKMQYNERSIKKSILTDFIIESSSRWILYKDLENKLIKEFPSLSKDKLKTFLHDMFKNQFIISELIPNLLENNPFAYFLNRLKNIDSQLENTFSSLNEHLKQYNATIPGHGLQLLEKINKMLCEMYPKKSKFDQKSIFVQVDTAFSSESTLSYKVAKEAADAASLIWKIDSSSSRKKKSDNYYFQFIEKYGTDQLVPFFDLINENIGLGIPAYYLSGKEAVNYVEKKDSFEWFLSKKYQEAVYLRRKEVVLIDEEIQHYFKKKPQVIDIPTSLEIFCEILAKDQAAIDAGDFNLTIGLSQISQPIGGTFGRFLHILPKEARTSLLKTYAIEQKLVPEKLYVKFSWLPASSGVGNVMIGNSLRDFSLVFPSSDRDMNIILYEDIYVGASQRGLYLFSKRLNQELILLTDNLVNQYFAPPAFEFLLDISKENISPMQGIYWDQFDYFSYLPRVRYNKTYLSLARWYLRLKEISLKKNPSIEDLIVWLKKWNVCRFVMMVDHEQYLLLDIQEESHLSIILSNLIRNDKVCLIEKKSIKKSTWAQSNKGSHFTEIIIPLLKNQSIANKMHVYPQIRKDKSKCIEKRTHRLGSNWIYIKLFCSKNTQEDFLQKILPSFIEKITKNKICEKWFYIRYEESTINPHIRLRIKFSQNQFLQVILSIINKWSERLIQEGFLKDISFHSYERELERYGGIGLIEYAEGLFHADSITCIALLQGYSKITPLPLYGIAALSIIDFLISLKLSKEDQIAILQEIFSSKEALEGYRFYKKQLLDLTSTKISNESSSSLKQIFSIRHLASKSYAKKAKTEGIDFLSIQGKKILHSFIHMHCNRLMGVDSSIEEKSILFAAETIKKSLYALEK